MRELVAADDLGASRDLRGALALPEAYPQRPAEVEVRETHISWVFLAGDRAFKLKKPLVLDFVDYGSAERRRAMCEAEVRLNRRLAPRIYLGVRGVALARGGARLTDADDPRAVDFVVEMRRFDERRTLAAMLERGELRREQVRDVAEALARFHARADRVDGTASPVLAVERRWQRNAHELLGSIEQRGEIGRVLALERFAHAFVDGHAESLRARAAAGCVRDGHGDLRAEHVLIGERVEVVDCVEFDPGLRALDVADDLAFLVFDLAARGEERLAEVLVDAYREAGGDLGEDSLIAFYAAQRALVRAKVGLVRAGQLPAGGAAHGRQSARARDLIAVGERFAWRARLPLTIIVCGLPASGKSTVASALAERSGLPHLSSDVTRKRLAGLSAFERGPAELYAAAHSERTYRELGRRARLALAAGTGAIVDATFRRAADRAAFADELGERAPRLFIECLAPPAVLAERAVRRELDPLRVSDADAEVVAREQGSWEPLHEVPAGLHLPVRADRPPERIVDDVLALLDARLQAREPSVVRRRFGAPPTDGAEREGP